MRMLPARSLDPNPARVKKAVAEVKHFSAPLKGLSLSSKLANTDQLTAPILENFIIEEDRIRSRFGSRLAYTHAAHQPIWALISYHGGVDRIAAATNGEIRMLDDALVKDGFTSNDWHWTSFSNLSATEYTVMVNGSDGVWSWNGDTSSTDPVTVAVTNLSPTNPAICTVDHADIDKFADGMIVKIEGGVAPVMDTANGQRLITAVNDVPDTFQLVGVDLSAPGGVAQAVTAIIPGTGLIKEAVTAPTYAAHIDPDQFDIVISHMNRLWFADKSNLSVYYLPIQQKSGEVLEIPLNAVFRRGGSIRAMYTWTRDGGAGLDDVLAIFSSNGECVLYQGVDPDTDLGLAGIFRFDSPMSKHCVLNYGGELHVLISTGFVPMSTLLKAETDNLGNYDKNIYTVFQKHAQWRDYPGWSVFLNPNTGRAVCNMPMGQTNQYHQHVRAMQNPAWTHWSGLPARCWGWVRDMVYFGSDDGRVYEFSPNYLSDQDNLGNPIPIHCDVQWAWSAYGTSAIKQFKMVLAYIVTDGVPRPFIDFRVDYDGSEAANKPDPTEAGEGAEWDVSPWDEEEDTEGVLWATGVKSWNNWQGVAAIGRVGAPRVAVKILNCSFAITGIDVLFETGNVFG